MSTNSSCNQSSDNLIYATKVYLGSKLALPLIIDLPRDRCRSDETQAH